MLQLLTECEEYDRLRQKSRQAEEAAERRPEPENLEAENAPDMAAEMAEAAEPVTGDISAPNSDILPAEHRPEQGSHKAENMPDMAAKIGEITDISAQTANISLDKQIQGLEEKIRCCAAEIEAVDLALTEGERQLLELQAQREAVLSAEERLQAARESYEAGQKKQEMLQKTKYFLEQARSLFTQKYRAPLLTAFQQYYHRLTGQTADEYFLDANLHLTLREAGLQREITFFSAGRQDLIGFCMRLALVKVMYGQEKPFILLDDPFANWDQDSIEKGLQFLREISREYQILYFTCHPSRALSFGE